MKDNIFEHLSKFSHRQDENYLTECFVFVLKYLLNNEKPSGLRLLDLICIRDREFSFEPNEKITIRTQHRTKYGIPDIEITTPDKLIYIEVKFGSGLRYKQISDYKKMLNKSKKSIKNINLLSRFDVEFKDGEERP
jgi:hypothetical protein